MGAIYQRLPNALVLVANPFPLINMSCEIDEEGKKVYTKNELVKPAKADDYSVTENALSGINLKISPRRCSTDIVDLDNKIN